MRRFALACVASLFVLVALPSGFALAADSVDNAITSLKTSPVYIEPGSTNTTRDSAAKLQSSLTHDDHIVLVVLPSSAKSDSTSVDQIVQRIDDATGHKYIIGLSVGNETVGYSRILPSGVASDSMDRASSLNNDPVGALTTYSKIIHAWQIAHPESTTTTSTTQHDSSSAVPFAVGGGALLSVVLIVAMVFRRRRNDSLSISNVRFKKTPNTVKDQMAAVLDLRMQVRNEKLIASLTNIARHTEAYFRNAKVQPDGTYRNVAEIRKNIELLQSVVGRYIKVQNESVYYRNAPDLENEYRAAVFSTERFMLEQVRSANADEEFDYRKMANILSATDLRSIRQEGR